MPPEKNPHRSTLLTRYKQLVDQDLPLAAKIKSDAQPRWPVHLNHCFGRIILDHICQRPWREVLQPPAVRHMNMGQLGKAVQVGEGILSGIVDLEKLNRESLQMRAKSRSMPGSKGQANEPLVHAVHAGSQSHSASPTTIISSPNLITATEPKSRSSPADLEDLPAKANSTSESRPKNKKKKNIRDYFKSPVKVEVE
jgi:methylated-DNA-[protein]-cysteine S-methyltransferase